MENKKIDLRKISSEEVAKLKMKAMELRDQGLSNKEVALKFNLDPTVLSRWYSQYVKNYRQTQESLRRGRKQGTHKKLTNYQENVIIKKLQELPDLMDKKFVQKIIEEKYKIKVPITTVGDYLKKWGVNSSFIKNFENEFIANVGIDDFQLTKQEIMKREGILIWVNIVNSKLETGIDIYSISTRSIKNKLIFKFYNKPIHSLDLIDFTKQISASFTKHLYVIFSTKNIQFSDNHYCFENSEKITFIYNV